MSPADYLDELRRHDWYYEYSDDHRAWTKGRDNGRRLQAICQEDPLLSRMYSDYNKWIFMSPQQREANEAPHLKDYIS